MQSIPGRRLLRLHAAIVLPLLVLTFHPQNSYAQGVGPNSIITTVAGGSWQFRGDGKPAVNAPLGDVAGVAVDSAGNVYAADPQNELVVKVSPTGVLTVAAGNGICCYSGDGGPATSASLYEPFGAAVDGAGNLYIADQNASVIRKVSPAGVISTVAGDLYLGGTFSGDGGPATSAGLDYPWGVAVDGVGNLYIADSDNNRIRKVSPSGIITTVAGSGPAGLYTGGYAGDGGPATSAYLNSPNGVAVDGTGNLYIADSGNYRIRKVSPGGIITTVAGNGGYGFSGDGGPATSASLCQPQGLAP